MEKKGLDEKEGRQELLDEHAESSENSRIPMDKGWAWMTVLGCFGMHVTVVGGAKSLGVLLVEVQDRFPGVPARQLGLVLGLSTTFMFGLGLVANMLATRFTSRAVVFVGGLLACAGFVMTAFIDRFWMMYLTYSVTCGVGYALSYSPSLVFVGLHFKKRRSLANGLSLAGSGIGSFALPNLMRWMLNVYGWTGCCMVMGAIMLHVCACALLFRPHSSYKPRKAFVEQRENSKIADTLSEKDQETIKLVRSITESDRCESGTCSHESEHGRLKGSKQLQEDMDISENNSESSCRNRVTVNKLERVENKRKNGEDEASRSSSGNSALDVKPVHYQRASHPSGRVFNRSLLSNPVMIIYIAFGFLVNFGYPNIFFMLPADAETSEPDSYVTIKREIAKEDNCCRIDDKRGYLPLVTLKTS
ncbi:monocarboxylate transporter 14, partial [Plakobranchus ocellatus]